MECDGGVVGLGRRSAGANAKGVFSPALGKLVISFSRRRHMQNNALSHLRDVRIRSPTHRLRPALKVTKTAIRLLC